METRQESRKIKEIIFFQIKVREIKEKYIPQKFDLIWVKNLIYPTIDSHIEGIKKSTMTDKII